MFPWAFPGELVLLPFNRPRGLVGYVVYNPIHLTLQGIGDLRADV